VPEQSAWPARKLMYSQLFIGFILFILVSGPNIAWQLSLAGKIRNSDIDGAAMGAILANSSVLKSIPALKEVNFTALKQDFLSASSKVNKDQYTYTLIGCSVFLVMLPFVCFCFARGAIESKSTCRMSCICCVEGLCGMSSFLIWFLPLALGAAVCLHLQSDKTFLNCETIVPWVQNAVTKSIVGEVDGQQPPKVIEVEPLTMAIQPTLTLTLKELFQAANFTAPFQTSYLDAVSTLVTPAQVNQLTVNWLAQFKAQYPGAVATETIPLSAATTDFLDFMFNKTAIAQHNFCNTQVTNIYGSVGIVGAVLMGMAIAAGCKVFACCLGCCEAWAARNSFALSSINVVGHAQKVLEQHEADPLLSTQLSGGPAAPLGSMGPNPERKGVFEACCTNCGRK